MGALVMVQQGEMVEHQTAHIALEADVGYGVLEIWSGGRSISALCCKRAAKTAYRDGFVHDQLSAIDRDPGDAVRDRHLVDQGTVGVPERLQVLYRFRVIGQLRQIHGAQRLQMAPREREERTKCIILVRLRCPLAVVAAAAAAIVPGFTKGGGGFRTTTSKQTRRVR